jgi:hypothetical protein
MEELVITTAQQRTCRSPSAISSAYFCHKTAAQSEEGRKLYFNSFFLI